MTLLEAAPLATVLTDLPDGLRLALHGELSSTTSPGLEALLYSLRESGERRIVLDLRDAQVIGSVASVLGRWAAVAGAAADTYELDFTA